MNERQKPEAKTPASASRPDKLPAKEIGRNADGQPQAKSEQQSRPSAGGTSFAGQSRGNQTESVAKQAREQRSQDEGADSGTKTGK